MEDLKSKHNQVVKQNYFLTALQMKLRKMKMEKMAIAHKAELKDKEFKS